VNPIFLITGFLSVTPLFPSMKTHPAPPATQKLFRVEFRSVDYLLCEVEAADEDEARQKADALADDGALDLDEAHSYIEIQSVEELPATS
jgi:hypothetical protein